MKPQHFRYFLFLLIIFALSSLVGCDTRKSQTTDENSQKEFGHLSLNKQWKGDFDGMVERRLVRALVVYNKMQFFIDQGLSRGVSVEMLEAFKKTINAGNKNEALQIDLIFLPVYRDQLIPSLVEGKGDIAELNTGWRLRQRSGSRALRNAGGLC